MQILISIREFLATPALIVGLVTLLGLVLQKKPLEQIVKGVVTAIIGFVILDMGADFLQNEPLYDFGILFNFVFHIQGIVPNMEAVSSIGISQFASEISMVMLFGMIANLIMAKFGPFHYIFLTGHHTMYMACLLTIVLEALGMSEWRIIFCGALILGLLMALMPFLASKEMKKITGNEAIALGHFSTVGYILAAKIAWLVTRRNYWQAEKQKDTSVSGEAVTEKKSKGLLRSAEEMQFPLKLSFMRDTNVGIFLVMTSMFLILTGTAYYRAGFADLDISYFSDSYSNWCIYALVEGAKFSAAIYIILAGVRLIIAEIVPAFKGISRKMVPDAKPAVDCPVLFSYAPNAVMIGFLCSFLGGLVMMFIMKWLSMQNETMFYVIVPGMVAHFFCGGTAGVFANAEGGIKGCVIGSFVHGMLISALSFLVLTALGTVSMMGTTFSDTDFCVTGIILGKLGELLSTGGIMALTIFLFLLPIFGTQMQKKKKSEI